MTFLLFGLCITVLVYDALFLRVPNKLLLLALTVHAACLLITGHGIGGEHGVTVAQSLIGGMIGAILFAPLYALRAMGAGDVKFFALLGALLGPGYLIPLWLIGSLLAGLHAVTIYLSRSGAAMMPAGLDRTFRQITDSTLYRRVLDKRQGRQGIPYAAYLAIATIMTTTYRQL